MDKLIAIQYLIKRTCCKVRLKVYHEDLATEWRGGFGLPVKGYIEVVGPERIEDVEWIELDPIVVTHIGRLMPPEVTVITDEIVQTLYKEVINYKIVRGIVRIYGQQLQ
ncbi:hypothetical protein SAMN06265337_2183 [Hymenobacter gelipurpurascens]|uniref:Uncharacterized protein n=1 Tax=Hymenobacter gelipurpurascens TaxID=89968 RepID=A0A212TQI0_9BACT|nr:DUF6678 family protein [Hymenobacter gelipurpurascens]SNC68116.1 hypothetical protein SAMN06265337_2183 [Hymenobacter gelipurpurascens]